MIEDRILLFITKVSGPGYRTVCDSVGNPRGTHSEVFWTSFFIYNKIHCISYLAACPYCLSFDQAAPITEHSGMTIQCTRELRGLGVGVGGV